MSMASPNYARQIIALHNQLTRQARRLDWKAQLRTATSTIAIAFTVGTLGDSYLIGETAA